METEAFKLVAALDLTLMVPALGLGGYLLFRRKSWGYVISSLAGVQASLYLLVLSVNSLVAMQRGLGGRCRAADLGRTAGDDDRCDGGSVRQHP